MDSPTNAIENVITHMTPISRWNKNNYNNNHSTTTSTNDRDDNSTKKEIDTTCAHPIHYHSFCKPSILSLSFVRSRFRKCHGCGELLVSGSDVVVCLACGVFAHRPCAFECNGTMGLCEVNKPLIEVRLKLIREANGCCDDHSDDDDNDNSNRNEIPQPSQEEEEEATATQPVHSTPIDDSNETKHSNMDTPNSHSSLKPPPPPQMFDISTTSLDTNEDDDNDDKTPSSLSSQVWSSNGPPVHWALSSPDTLKGLKPIIDSSSSKEEGENEHDETQKQKEQQQQQAAALSFYNINRALQENIVAHWIKNSSNNRKKEDLDNDYGEDGNDTTASSPATDNDTSTNDKTTIISKSLSEGITNDRDKNDSTADTTNSTCTTTQELVMEESIALMEQIQINASGEEDHQQHQHHHDTQIANSQEMQVLLNRKSPNPPPPTKTQVVYKNVSDTVEIVKKTSTTRKTIGIASVAGGLAGGVAGLVIAGPAGAYLGAKIGQYACVAGAVIEGTIGVGVLAAGVAGTMFTVNQLKDGEKRMLTIGEKGTEQKVVLVRPNIVVDPIWNDIVDDARRNAPKDEMGGGMIKSLIINKGNGEQVDKKVRMKRDADIVKADESEIATIDKVMLLVSSSLNDKKSLPGHIYRHLVWEHQCRARKRHEEGKEDELARATREDTHAIIKHITATLLEVRPGFCSSPSITEMSATAVEALVFGEMYDCIFDEIIRETRDLDQTLMAKISDFQIHIARQSQKMNDSNNEGSESTAFQIEELVTEAALEPLRKLPEPHSVAGKLEHIVEFLEMISHHFNMNLSVKKAMGADSLLKMVCQHIIVAKVPNLNAEIVFLEEFARDEQLLRGKEGYALVTITASLHFMNASIDFGKDIFHEDDD